MKADENNDQQFTVCEVLESPAFQILARAEGHMMRHRRFDATAEAH